MYTSTMGCFSATFRTSVITQTFRFSTKYVYINLLFNYKETSMIISARA